MGLCPTNVENKLRFVPLVYLSRSVGQSLLTPEFASGESYRGSEIRRGRRVIAVPIDDLSVRGLIAFRRLPQTAFLETDAA